MEYSDPNGQYSGPNGQYSGPNGQYSDPNGQYSGPNGQYSGPNGQYSDPKGQYSDPKGQYSDPKEQYSDPNGQYSGPNGQYSGPNGQYSGPNGQYSDPNGQYSGPNGQHSDPNGQHSDPNGQHSGPNGQCVSYYELQNVNIEICVSLVVCRCLCVPIGLDGRCQSKSTCTHCLRSPGCAWCKQKVLKACDNLIILGSTVIQVRVPQSFEVRFKHALGFPIDLYYLMDMSFSMKDDLAKFKNLGREVVTAMKNITSAVRIGFGSFVDKRVGPYANINPVKLANPCPASYTDPCQPTFSFRHTLKLTEDVEEFERSVSRQYISSNLDNPESGLDAIMQVAVCQSEIGWGNAYRILVYTSDDVFHLAGDGKLAGLFQPNDGQCHLNSEVRSIAFDYPSVGHLAEVLSANDIKVIFAVTDEHTENYEALSKLLPLSVVGLLEQDSSNIVHLISEAYNVSNLFSSIRLEHHEVPLGLKVSYTSHCGDGQDRPAPGQDRGECDQVGINQQNLPVMPGEPYAKRHCKYPIPEKQRHTSGSAL
uniref:Integrin beta subunit VWA domain-containing protein n=1 Tax=Esox lucius TaxID=8010 RepID=A0A6Q2YAR3_ESOLU